AIAILRVLAKGGHFDHARPLGPHHRDHAEGGAQRQSSLVAEQGADFRRHSAGGHVVVFGLAVQQFVADAAAGPVGLEAGRTELANHIQGKVTLLFRINHESNKIVTQILRYGNLGYDALPSSYMERLPSRVQSYQTDRTFNPRNLPHDGSPSL